MLYRQASLWLFMRYKTQNKRKITNSTPSQALANCRNMRYNDNDNIYQADGRCGMAVTYKKLWTLLDKRNMTVAELRKISGIAPNTMTKLRRDEPVMLPVLDKICSTLKCNYGDIMDYVPEREAEL